MTHDLKLYLLKHLKNRAEHSLNLYESFVRTGNKSEAKKQKIEADKFEKYLIEFKSI